MLATAAGYADTSAFQFDDATSLSTRTQALAQSWEFLYRHQTNSEGAAQLLMAAAAAAAVAATKVAADQQPNAGGG